MTWTICHNPRCGKSRQTLALLRAHGIEPDIYLYLQTPPERGELEATLRRLGLTARDLLRRKERLVKELGLNPDESTEEDLLDAMAKHPILIERPIVAFGPYARIGRPPENILSLLETPGH